MLKNKTVLAGWHLDKNINVVMNEEQLKEAKAVIQMVSNKNQGLLPDPTIDQLDDDGKDAEDSVESDNGADEPFAKFLKVKGKESSNITSESSIKKKSKLCDLDKDMEQYDKMPVPRKGPNIIVWWNEMSEQYPTLSIAALDVISAPVTEVTVERLFSHLKLILSRHRSRLTIELFEVIMFLRINKHFEKKNPKSDLNQNKNVESIECTSEKFSSQFFFVPDSARLGDSA